MFSVDDLRQLLTRLERIAPAAASEATIRVSVPELHVVLRRLLMEEVSIKNLPRILEAIALRACLTHEAEDLVNSARLAISRAMCHELCGEDGRLYVVMFDRPATDYIQAQLADGDMAKTDWVHNLVVCLSRFFRDAPERRRNLALLVEADVPPPPLEARSPRAWAAGGAVPRRSPDRSAAGSGSHPRPGRPRRAARLARRHRRGSTRPRPRRQAPASW
jgi:flagellar biosynthesis component FlhA